MAYGGAIGPKGTLKLKVIRAKKNRWYMRWWRKIQRIIKGKHGNNNSSA